jgi:hypothetical protein
MQKTPTFENEYQRKAFIRAEFDKFTRDLADSAPAPTPRTWAFELETPDADNIATALASAYRARTPELAEIMIETGETDPRDLIAFCQDGSVEKHGDNAGADCECDCRDCTYHECDCDNCDQNNDSPEHDCGNADCYNGSGDYQEIKPTSYCEGTHPAHLALLDLADIETAEINATCGLHIHLGSADLTARDIANTIRVYRALGHILDPIAGRAGTYYAQKNSDSQAFRAQFQREATEKYYAVNTAPHYAGHRAQTIEFRQHEGTNSTAEIRAWAMLLMQIVEFAKTNRTTLWLESAQTFAEAWQLLQVPAKH